MDIDKGELHYDEAVAYLTENVASLLMLDALFDGACKELNQFRVNGKKGAFYDGLTARLLLSILVDADRHDAACFAYGEDALAQQPAPIWGELLERFDAYADVYKRQIISIIYAPPYMRRAFLTLSLTGFLVTTSSTSLSSTGRLPWIDNI